MGVAEAFLIDYTNKRLYISGDTNVYTVNALYSYLQDTFDELAQMDDPVPMSAQTPTEYTLINGWFAGDSVYKYLETGALTTSGWDGLANNDGIRLLTFAAGYASAVSTDIGKTVSDNQGDTGVLLDYNNNLKKWWIRVGDTGDSFIGDSLQVHAGTGKGDSDHTSKTGENLWSNLYSLGTIEAETYIYIIQDGSKITNYGDSEAWWGDSHIDVLIKTKEAGDTIDSGDLTIFARKYQKLYDHFPINVKAGGRNAVPLATANDINNTRGGDTVGDTMGITYTFGDTLQDLGNGNGDTYYDVMVDCNGKYVLDMYENTKYYTRRNSDKKLGDSGDTVDGEQYLSANPGTYTDVKQAPFGTFAGGKFFGARGVWIHNYNVDDNQNFQLIDTAGTTQTPPVTVTVKVQSLVSGDRVGVFITSGGAIEKTTYTGDSVVNTAGTLTFTVSETIATDVPSSGYFRIYRSGDSEWLKVYSSYSGKVFTIDGDSLDVTHDQNDSLYVPYIDAQCGDSYISNTFVYDAPVDVLTRVRKKGIIPFQITGNVDSGGLTVNAIRTTDSIVSA